MSQGLFHKSFKFLVGKSKWSATKSQYTSTAVNLVDNKNKLYQTLKLLIQRYVQF